MVTAIQSMVNMANNTRKKRSIFLPWLITRSEDGVETDILPMVRTVGESVTVRVVSAKRMIG